VPQAPAPNRRERLEQALRRDGAACVWCRRPLAPGDRDLTTEHLVPRIKGGPSWLENEVAACRGCNRTRGHTAPSAWLEACEQRGLQPDRAAVERALLRLCDAIEARGGARRARPYVAGQLRRLGLRDAVPPAWR
jgi:hypothetical protein